MKFINVEEFLKQSKEVQKVLLDWWKPDYSDLVGKPNGEYCLVDDLMIPHRPNSFKEKYIYNSKYIPLFVEEHLRNFLEEKTGKTCDIFMDIDDEEYMVYMYNVGTDEEFEYNKVINIQEFRNLGKDLLKAYWQVVCKIASENVT